MFLYKYLCVFKGDFSYERNTSLLDPLEHVVKVASVTSVLNIFSPSLEHRQINVNSCYTEIVGAFSLI